MKNNCTPTLEDIGNNIRKWRIIKGHTQKSFSDKLDISIVSLSKIETGKTDISLSRFCEIAQALNVDGGKLLVDPDTLIK